jgi:catechol 2,3-dioxygenase-like lactoylglutathione lyase family enzyme
MKTARLTSSAPVLFVKDVVASANYYRDALGFSYDRFWGEPPDFVILRRDGLHVMLSAAPHGHQIAPNWKIHSGIWNIYFWVDDVDSLYAEYEKRGARIDYQLSNKPYGVREFGVQDLDGYDVAFGELRPPPTA